MAAAAIRRDSVCVEWPSARFLCLSDEKTQELACFTLEEMNAYVASFGPEVQYVGIKMEYLEACDEGGERVWITKRGLPFPFCTKSPSLPIDQTVEVTPKEWKVWGFELLPAGIWVSKRSFMNFEAGFYFQVERGNQVTARQITPGLEFGEFVSLLQPDGEELADYLAKYKAKLDVLELEYPEYIAAHIEATKQVSREMQRVWHEKDEIMSLFMSLSEYEEGLRSRLPGLENCRFFFCPDPDDLGVPQVKIEWVGG